MTLLLILFLEATAAQQPDEPHPFSPDQLATYEELFQRLSTGDPTMRAGADAFVRSNPENPRAHYLAGVTLLQAGDRLHARLELEHALQMGIGPARRRGELLTALAQAWLPDDLGRARAYANEAIRLVPERRDLLLGLLARFEQQAQEDAAAQAKLAEIARLPSPGGAIADQRPSLFTVEWNGRREQWAEAVVLTLTIALVSLWAGLGVIAFAARLLSRSELGALADIRTDLQKGVHTAEEVRVERAYGAVAGAAVALLVIAMPLLLAVTVGLAVALGWLMLQAHFGFYSIIALLFVSAASAAWGILRALLARVVPLRGHVLGRSEEPHLYEVLDEVAVVARSLPVREVALEPGPSIGVLERGSMLTVLLGRGVRVLSLGYAAMQELTLGELRAVLAHEYGHFSHGETRLAPVIRRAELVSILMLHGIARGGWTAYLNPALWYLRAFIPVFLRLNRARDRRRELLADRVSALAYGGETFARALSKMNHAAQDLERAVGLLYVLRSMGLTQDGVYGVQDMKRKDFPLPLRRALARDRVPTPADSHPPDGERIDWVRGIQGAVAEDKRPALELLSNPGRLAVELSAELLRRVQFPDPMLPLPVRPVEEVVPALSHLLDAHELAHREPREALEFVESSVAEASEVLGPEHPCLRPALMWLSERRQASGDAAGADEASHRARRIAPMPGAPLR
jgi:Zn-dependent protease with chaperone function